MQRQCKGHRRDGSQCTNAPMKGQLVCRMHGGATAKSRAAAVRRQALADIDRDVESFGLGGTDVDPGETLLRLLSQARARAQTYAAQIAELVTEHGLAEALTGDTLMVNPNYVGGKNANGQPKFVKVGEYQRALTQLENAERDRAARFAKLAIDAGLAERMQKLAENQGRLIEAVLLAAFEALQLTPEQRRAAPDAIRAALAVAT